MSNERNNIEQLIQQLSNGNMALAGALRRYYDSLMESGRSDTLLRVPKTREQTEFRQLLESNSVAVAAIADEVIKQRFSRPTVDLISVPKGYTFGDMPQGYPKQKKNIKNAFPISNRRLWERTQKDTPLVPFYKEGNVIRLIGFDKETNRTCLFSIICDEGNSVQAANTKLVLYMAGQEAGLLNIERPTYFPNSVHEDLMRGANGEILTTKGLPNIAYADPTGAETHVYSMRDRLMDPHGYSATVESLNDGFGTIQAGSTRAVVTTPKLLQKPGDHTIRTTGPSIKALTLGGNGIFTQTCPTHLRKYQFADHFEAFCQRNNIMYVPIANYMRADRYGKQMDSYFPDGAMYFEDKETLEAFADETFSSPATYEIIKNHFEEQIKSIKQTLSEEELAPNPDELYVGKPGAQTPAYIDKELYVEVSDKTLVLPSDIRKQDKVSPDGKITLHDYSKDLSPEQ